MKKKILTLLLAASMAASLLAGCGSKDDKAKGDTDTKTEAADKSGEEKTLVYGSGDYTNINPALYEHGEINSLIFAGMTEWYLLLQRAGSGMRRPKPIPFI